MGPQTLISRLLTRSASWLRGEDLPSRTGQALAWLGVVVLLALGLASGLVALVVVVAANLAEGLVSLVAAGGSPLAIAVAIVFLIRARLRARRSHVEADEASQPDQSAEPVAIPIERVAAIDTPPVAAGPRADRKEAPEPEPGRACRRSRWSSGARRFHAASNRSPSRPPSGRVTRAGRSKLRRFTPTTKPNRTPTTVPLGTEQTRSAAGDGPSSTSPT